MYVNPHLRAPFCKTFTRPLLCHLASLAPHFPQECSTSLSEDIKYGTHPRQQQKQRIAAQPLNTKTKVNHQIQYLNYPWKSNLLRSPTTNSLNTRHLPFSTNRTINRTRRRLYTVQRYNGGITTRMARRRVVLLRVTLELCLSLRLGL